MEEKKVLPRWLPLESNPELLNGFLERMGAKGVEFTDVWGLDEELLAMVPQPVLAVCLLFPSKPINGIRQEQFKDKVIENPQTKNIFYLSQLPQFGNACGTIAIVHALANVPVVSFDENSPLKKFIQENHGLSPDEIGLNLATTQQVHEASEHTASGGQTATPDRDDRVDGHFICFVNHNGRLLELDGMMKGPIDHGESLPERFLFDAAEIVRNQFMALAPGDVNFNLTAMVLK